MPSVRRSTLLRQPITGGNGQLKSRSISCLFVSARRRGQNPPLVETIKDINKALEHCLPVQVETIRNRSKRALVHYLPARDILLRVKEYCPRFTEKLPEKIWCCSLALVRFQTESAMSWNSWEKYHSSIVENATTMKSIILEKVKSVRTMMVARNFRIPLLWSRWDTESRRYLTCSDVRYNFSTSPIWWNQT